MKNSSVERQLFLCVKKLIQFGFEMFQIELSRSEKRIFLPKKTSFVKNKYKNTVKKRENSQKAQRSIEREKEIQ